MRSSQRLAILVLVLGLAAIIEVRAWEPEKPTAPPKTPGECRQLVLQEIAEFRRLKGPVISGGDEHIGRAANASFHEAQMQARIALAIAGDRDAVAELVKQLDLDQADDEAWARAHSERDHGVYPSWSPTVRLVNAALETSRPELAQKMRQRMIRLWQVEPRPTFPNYDAALLDKCTLTELKTIGDSGRATRRCPTAARRSSAQPARARAFLWHLYRRPDRAGRLVEPMRGADHRHGVFLPVVSRRRRVEG